jgi:diguanylate cyclase (GGDEF)-like protein/PAS domain S-box-containing protein
MSVSDVRHYLRDLVERLVAALSGSSVDTQAASEVGARLVAAGFTGARSLSVTFDVVGRAFPAVPGDAAVPAGYGRVIELLGALAGGFTQALRNQLCGPQDELTRALSQAWRDGEWDRRGSEAWFQEVFDCCAVGIVISEPGGRIVQTNRALEDTLGYCPGELLGRDLSELFFPGHRATVKMRYDALVTGGESRFRIRFPLRRADDQTAWVYLAASVLSDPEQATRYLVTMADDITELQLLEQRLNHQTLHDLQTGLPNRQYLMSRLEQVLGRLEPSAVITLLHLDLDGFSAINNGLGHQVGDQMLNVVARRLEAVVADQQAMVARLGADEYAILLEAGEPISDVGAFAEIINTELAEPFYIDGVGMAVTATIGVVQHRVAGTNPEELMRAASATLSRIRGRGPRQWALFDPHIDAVERAQLGLAATMPGALETGELTVTYQPVVTLDDHRLVGIEAALSWQHPQLGVLSHQHCVQAAERTGAVHDLGRWLLRTAAEQAMSWQGHIGPSVPPLMVNLMPSQTQDPDLVAKLRQVLHQTGLPAAKLELRAPVAAIRTVTGELAGEGGAHAEDNLHVLTELGLRTGLHDFAGGIGGFRCLADLSVSAVKIAQPIAQQVANDPSRLLSQTARAMVHAVRAAGVEVVAFPVDSPKQASCWPWIGANWAVGAVFGQPGPPQHIETLLNAQTDS